MGKIAFCVVLLILLSSCVPSTLTNRVENDKEGPSGQFTATQQENQTAKYGGTMRLTGTWSPVTLNPLLDIALHYPAISPIFSCLLRHNENGELESDLAKTYQISEDERSSIFTLHENASWHDGHSFNSSDVQFTYETVISNPEVHPDLPHLVAYIDSITVLNATAIMFNLSEKFSPFLSNTANIPIIPRHIYSDPNYTLSTNPANTNPVGTGPFKFSSWTPGQNLTLQAFNGYFRGRPYLDSLQIRYDIAIENLGNSLNNNEIDMVVNRLDPSDLEQFKEVPGITTLTSYRLGFNWLGINLANPLLSNLTIRQAVSHAINKTQIAEVAFLGYAAEGTGPFPPSMGIWHNPNVTRYEYNASLAEELLDQIGYPRQPDGWRFDLSMKEYEGYLGTPDLDSCFMIRDFLLDVGINVTLELLSAAEYVNAWFTGDFELLGPMSWGFFGITQDPDVLHGFFHSEGEGNYWFYNNSRVDQLLEQGRLTCNVTLRKEIYDEVQDLIATDLPNIFVLFQQWRSAFNNDFHGVYSTSYTVPCSSLILEKVYYEPALSGEGNSPMYVSFVDSIGRRTGFHPSTGQGVTDIPNSTYSGVDSEPQLVKIRSPLGEYTVECYGTDNGSYSLEIVNIALNYKHVNIPASNIHVNETHVYHVRLYHDGSIFVFNTQVDANSDLVIDIFDAIILADAFGGTPSKPNWNPNADINSDDVVDIFDAIILAGHFGESW